MKVVINKCFGGFSLSHEAFLRLRELGHPDALAEPDYGEYWDDGSGPRKKLFDGFLWRIPRDDALLVQVVEELGAEASGDLAELKVIEIPDDVDWEVEEYDGLEHIREVSRVWS